MKASDVARAMYPDYREERLAKSTAAKTKRDGSWFGSRRTKAVKFRIPDHPDASAIPIRGINTALPVRFAPDGGAVPGDRIVGIMSPGEGVTIYPIQALALKDF